MSSLESITSGTESWHTTENTLNGQEENDNEINEHSVFVINNEIQVNIPDSGAQISTKSPIPLRQSNRRKKKKIFRNFPYRFPWTLFCISVVQVI